VLEARIEGDQTASQTNSVVSRRGACSACPFDARVRAGLDRSQAYTTGIAGGLFSPLIFADEAAVEASDTA